MVALSAALDLELHHLDVQTTFLHGELTEELYMKQLPFFEDSKLPQAVCRLHQSLNGLKQSPRVWYQRLHKFLLQAGYTRLHSETTIYICKHENNFIILGVYVDDLPILSNNATYLDLSKKELKASFPITDLGPMTHCLGIRVQCDRKKGTIYLSQSKYIHDILSRFDMLHCKLISTRMTIP